MNIRKLVNYFRDYRCHNGLHFCLIDNTRMARINQKLPRSKIGVRSVDIPFFIKACFIMI